MTNQEWQELKKRNKEQLSKFKTPMCCGEPSKRIGRLTVGEEIRVVHFECQICEACTSILPTIDC